MTRATAPVCVVLFLLLVLTSSANAQTTDFTYQGQLQNSAVPANGNFDFEFLLFDALAGGAQVGSTLTRNNVPVANGVFSVGLNFGNLFPGAARWMEIRVKPSGAGALTPLAPRQPFTSSPYAVRSLSAATAELASTAAGFFGTLGGDVAGTQAATVVNSVGGQTATNVANAAVLVTAATSANTPNALARRDASGDLTVNRLNAAVQYNLSGSRIIGSPGGQNLYVGVLAGNANGPGTNNAFFGQGAGRDNTASNNTFVGSLSGIKNTAGANNVAVGTATGQENLSGSDNTLVGESAGLNNTASNNTFVGSSAGRNNTGGQNNAYFGRSAGAGGTFGTDNAIFGANAGAINTGSSNSFFGRSAGTANLAGFENAFFGYQAGLANTGGGNNAFFGANAGQSNNGAGNNSFFGRGAGSSVTQGSFNTALGFAAGSTIITGANNTLVGATANVENSSLTFATALGSGAIATFSGQIMLGRNVDTVIAPNLFRVVTLGSAGATPLCRNVFNEISTCSSSLRYKTNFAEFRAGLSFVKQLRPISFDWKSGGMRDVGFGAEDVARIDPLFVTYNTAGEVEGVKYDRISVVLVNAVSEQQTQIELQQTRIELQQTQIEAQRNEIERQWKLIGRQQSDIDALKAHMCAQTPTAAVCVPAN